MRNKLFLRGADFLGFFNDFAQIFFPARAAFENDVRFLRRAFVLRLFAEVQRREAELLSDTVGFVFHLGVDTFCETQFLACKRIDSVDDNVAVHRL